MSACWLDLSPPVSSSTTPVPRAMPRIIDAIPGSDMDAQFENALAHRLAIAQIAEREVLEPDPDPRLRLEVAQAVQPFGKRLSAVLALV